METPMEEENVAIRLKLFMEKMGISNSQFADQCGIPRPSLSQLLNGRNKKISDVIVRQIHERYPELSVLWLMFGEGNMLNPTPLSVALASEASKFMDDDADADENEKENELTTPVITSQFVGSKVVTSPQQPSNIHLKIAQNSENLRKVKSITVFYDDNSYETFVPQR